MKKIIIAIIIIIVFISTFIIMNSINKEKLLKKYHYNITEEQQDVFNIEHEFINIEQKKYDNLFNDEYIKFKNISDDYYLVREIKSDPMYANIYNSSNNIVLTTWKSDNFYNDLSYEYFEDLMTDEFIKEYPKANLKEVLKRNNINNDLDLIHMIIKNMDKKVDKKSSKNEIINKFTFDAMLPLFVPYDKSSSINKIICFDGYQNGYVYITDKNTYINVKKENDNIRIIFSPKEEKNISEEQIIDVISSIEF